jgi:hypothetical protein
MSRSRDIYGEVNNETDLRHIFQDICEDVDDAESRPALTELYRRAGYLLTLTHAPSWEEKFGERTERLREVGKREFGETARKINHRAAEIGTQADYRETWGTRVVSTSSPRRYRSAESKYKGGARDIFVTYDLAQRTRGGAITLYPKIKRVYIAGDVKEVGAQTLWKGSARRAHRVRATRKGCRRHAFTAHRDGQAYPRQATSVRPTHQRFAEVVEVPRQARNVRFYPGGSCRTGMRTRYNGCPFVSCNSIAMECGLARQD